MTEVMEDAYLIDTNVALYHLGADSAWKAPCTRVIERILDGTLRAYASTEMVQEVAHHRLRVTRDPQAAAAEARAISTGVVVLAFDWEVLDLALDLVAQGTRGRDAVHAATAAAYGISKVISVDSDFDGIPGITRIDPADFL